MTRSLESRAEYITITKGELAELARAAAREVLAERQRTDIETQAKSIISVGPLVINLPAHEAFVSGQRIKLKPREFAVLSALAIHADNVMSREQLLRIAWPYPDEVEERTVDTHVCRVRSKLRAVLGGTRAELIDQIFGVGYVLRASMIAASEA